MRGEGSSDCSWPGTCLGIATGALAIEFLHPDKQSKEEVQESLGGFQHVCHEQKINALQTSLMVLLHHIA